jgi:preprotein translocase subunit YajC
MINRLILTMSTMLFVTTAVAEGVEMQTQQGSIVSSMLMFGVIFVMFYVLMIRPQNKRQKEHKDLIGNLTVGDEIITTGGILGKIAKVSDNFFILTISEGVDVPVQKQAVASALPKGTIKAL